MRLIKFIVPIILLHSILNGQVYYFKEDSVNKYQHYLEEIQKDHQEESFISSIKKDLDNEALHLNLCFALHFRSQFYSRNNQFQKAEDDLQKVIRNIRNHNYEEYLAYFLKDLGRIYIERGRYYKAADELKQALNLARKYNQPELVISIYLELARMSTQIGNLDESIKTYHKILNLQLESKQSSKLYSTYHVLSALKAEKKEEDSAFYFHHLAQNQLDKSSSQKLFHEHALQKTELFLLFRLKDSLDSQLISVQSLLRHCDHNEHLIKLNLLQGEAALQDHQDSLAEEYFNSAMDIARIENVTIQKISTLSQISDAYYRAGKYKMAFESLKHQKRLSSIVNSEHKESLKKDLQQASEMNIAQDEIKILKLEKKLAQESLEKNNLKNILLTKENKLQSQLLHSEELARKNIESENKIKANELELAQLKQKELEFTNKIQKESIEESKFNLVLLGLLSALIAILSYFLYRLYKKQKLKNQIIEKQSKELELINKEVHHRVKNNLQVIASLLDLQSNAVKNIELKEILQESKQRVQSMAFIHQNLYESEGVHNVDMNGYIRTLSNHLLNSYPLERKKIEIELDIEPIQLQMDTVISIGMIITELITNAIKYAFANMSQGLISVCLQKSNDKILLTVKDNGRGMNTDDLATKSGFGFKIIQSFCQKLKATMNINSQNGTSIEIFIHKFK